MKPYFGKQVIEAPRRGSSARSVKIKNIGRIVAEEDGPEYYGPLRIPMSMGGKQFAYDRKAEEKSFSDVLGPIESYLHSSVGRPWSAVHSELSRELGGGAWPLRHVLTMHVDVAVNTYRGVDGKVWHCAKHGGPEIVDGGYRTEFYVEPETGILRFHPPTRYKHWPFEEPKPADRLQLADGRQAVLISSIWFIGRYHFEADVKMPCCFETYEYGYGQMIRFVPAKYRMVQAVWPDYRHSSQLNHRFRPSEIPGRMIFTKIKQANKRELKEIWKLRRAEARALANRNQKRV